MYVMYKTGYRYLTAALNAIEEDENAAVVKQVHFMTALDNIAPQTTPNMLLFYEQFGSSNK